MTILSFASFSSVGTSAAGTRTIMSTWPALSCATRAESFGISLRTTFCHGEAPRQWPSKRSSTSSSFGVQETNRYGPVPIAALPELKASLALSLVRPAAAFAETMNRRMKSFGSVGAGPSVTTWSVCGSTTFASLTRRT